MSGMRLTPLRCAGNLIGAKGDLRKWSPENGRMVFANEAWWQSVLDGSYQGERLDSKRNGRLAGSGRKHPQVYFVILLTVT